MADSASPTGYPTMGALVDARAAPMASPQKNTGETLLLVGAILAMALGFVAIVTIALALAVFAVVSDIGDGPFPSAWPPAAYVWITVLFVQPIFAVVGTVLTFQARGLVQRGDAQRGWIRALVGGIFLAVSVTVAGVLVIVGAAMVKPTSPPSGSVHG